MALQKNAEVLSRFRQEAEITATLRHPHIVQVLDFNVTDQGYPYLVMEMLEGQSLAKRINDAGRASPGRRGRHRRADRAGAARGACPRDRPPRSQAGQRHAPVRRWREGFREGARLRDLAGELAPAADQRRRGGGDAPVHGARAGARPAGGDRFAQRPVLAGGHRLRAAHRTASRSAPRIRSPSSIRWCTPIRHRRRRWSPAWDRPSTRSS